MMRLTYQPLSKLLLSICIAAISAQQAAAATPARFYWKGLTGTKAVPVIGMSMSGNVNLADPSYMVVPNGSFEATIVTAGFAQTFSIADHAAMLAVLLPMGNVSGEGSLLGSTFKESASGYGDPLIELDINLIGPGSIMNIPDLIRYEPGFSLDLLVDVAFPLGDYDNSKSVNIGQNRWYGRIGAPIVWQLGPWISGEKTTLEFLPQVWIFGDNDDFTGRTLSTEPIYEIDTHLTHDFHKNLWGAVDMTWVSGGKATLDGVTGEDLSMLTAGFTLGYNINENLQVTVGYSSSINDSELTDPQIDTFMLTLVYGWHSLVDGMNRLNNK